MACVSKTDYKRRLRESPPEIFHTQHLQKTRAEREATEIQKDIRFRTHLKKRGPVLPGLFGDGAPESGLTLKLTKQFNDLARQKVSNLLAQKGTSGAGVQYSELFGEALAFPIVSHDDLLGWLKALKPHIEIVFSKSKDRPHPRNPSPFFDDRVVVVNAEAIERWKPK